MSELKPCPFCGGRAVFTTKSNNSSHTCVGFDFAIECSVCHTIPPKASDSVTFRLSDSGMIVTIDDGRGKAIDAWNRRADHGQT